MLQETPQPVLSRLLKTSSSSLQDTAGGLDKSSKAKQAKVQTAGGAENASMLKLTPDILVLLQIEVKTPLCPLRANRFRLLLFDSPCGCESTACHRGKLFVCTLHAYYMLLVPIQRAILEREASTREHLLLQCGDMLWSATTAVAASVSAELAGPVELLRTELWTRLAAASLSVNCQTIQGLSVAYAFQALGEKCSVVPYKISSNVKHKLQLWRGVAHVVAGLALLATDFTV